MRSIETTWSGARRVRTVFAVVAALVMSGVMILTGSDSANADPFEVADLTVTVSDSPDPVIAGNNLTYTVTVTNNGPDPASDVSLTDILYAGTKFVSLSPVAGWSCLTPPVGAGGPVTCSNPSFAVGSAVFTLTAHVVETVAAGTVLDNAALVGTATTEGNPGDEVDTESTTVATSADLAVTVTDSPDPVLAGQNVTYTINATNAGPSAAATVSVTDTVPAGTAFESLSSPGGWSCVTPPVGGTGAVSCTNGSLAVGSFQFTLVVKVDAGTASGTVFSNTATASSSTTDPNPGNESGTATTTAATSADLSVTTIDSPDPVIAGDNLTYAITVTNAGPSAAAVALNDTLPIGTTFVSMQQNAGPTWSCSAPAGGGIGTVSCSIASLSAASSSQFELVVNINSGTPAGNVVANTATVSSTTTDPNPGNETATATTTVTHANEAPVATADDALAFEDGGAVSIDVLTNDTDFELGPLTVASGSWTQGAHGAVNCSTTACTYTPEPGYHGDDTFGYAVTDGQYSDAAVVSVTVIPVNDPPAPGTVEAGGGTAEIIVGEDSTITFNVLTNATDPDGDPLTVIGNTQPAHGTATCTADGNCIYTPTPGYHGPDSFTYTISDDGGVGQTFSIAAAAAAAAATVAGTATITVTEAPPASTTTTTTEPATTTTATTTPASAVPTTAPLAARGSPLPVDLPETGGDVMPVLATGMVLIAAGLVVTRRARRRRVLPAGLPS